MILNLTGVARFRSILWRRLYEQMSPLLEDGHSEKIAQLARFDQIARRCVVIEEAARTWWCFLNGPDTWKTLDSAQQSLFVREHMISDWAAEAYGAETTDPGHCDGWGCRMELQ